MMIKLEKGAPPAKLTDELKQKATEEYMKEGTCVWNLDWLKDALLKLSSNKCAYCESRLDRQSNYMEIEHFRDKKHHPEDVLNWKNLLPACKHCNAHKGIHDVEREPILNPFVDEPREHMYLKNYMYRKKDDLGQTTIDVLDLNDYPRLVTARFELGTRLIELLDDRKEEIEKGFASDRAKKRFKNRIRKLIAQCLPDSEYSAMCAALLIESQEYREIMTQMKDQALWDEEFEKYHVIIEANALL